MQPTTTPAHTNAAAPSGERIDLGSAVASLQLAGPVPLTIRRERRRTPRSSALGTGALYLVELPEAAHEVRSHPVVPGLVEGHRAFAVVERGEDGDIELGRVHLSLRDSTLAGTLPVARQVFASIVVDQVAPDGGLDCGDDLIAFLEACAARIGADGLVVTTLDHRLVTELSARGYLVDGPTLGEDDERDDTWRAIEERLEEMDLEDALARVQGTEPAVEVQLHGAPRADRTSWNASRSFQPRGHRQR